MKKTLGMLLLLVALCVVIYQKNPGFFSGMNLQNVSRQIALLAVFAIGEGIVILSGGIDLSVGSVIAFMGLLTTLLVADKGFSPAVACTIVLGASAVVGLAHGYLVTRVKLQPFIATLCTMLILRGLSRGLTGDETRGFGNQSLSFRELGIGAVGGVPIPVIILLVTAVIAHFFMRYTKYGRYLYAIGRNANAARYSGVKVDRMQTAAYLVCAMLAGLAGILYATYTNSTQPATTGQAYELYAIAAAVLGGCSMRGGEGTIPGIIIGASLIKVMNNGIILYGIDSVWEFAVIGVVILIGVFADSVVKQRSAKRAGKQTAAKAPAEATKVG